MYVISSLQMTLPSSPMSSSVDVSQSQIEQMSPCFDIQEFRCRSQGSNDSFEVFLPAIEVMSICTQLSKQKSAFGTEKRRVQFSLMPAVFGVDGSSPHHVTSWGYKPFLFPNNKENASKRRRVDMAKMNRRDEWRFEEHSQRWGYSSPAFRFRSPPPQVYKLKNSLNKSEQNSAEQSAVPGMTIQQAILFQRNLNTKFLTNDESRKHNNTPVCSLEPSTLQVPLTKHASMPNLKSIQICYGGKERKGSEQYHSRRQYRNVSTRSRGKPHTEMVTNIENNTVIAKCPLCTSESQDPLKRDFIQAKKISIKLPCLDTNQET